MNAFTKYTTIEGDRWDAIANKAYGDPFQVNKIAQANPKEALTVLFPGGVDLLIPIVVSQQTINPALLPPWKRKNNQPSTGLATIDASKFLSLPSSAPGSFDDSFD